jgi:glycyl-tRNA synthetase alpha subunit
VQGGAGRVKGSLESQSPATSSNTSDLHHFALHLFNILDARAPISVTERVALIARLRKLACQVAAIYLDRQTAPEVPA